MKIYFIASTLPFYFFIKNKIGKNDLIIVSNQRLKKSITKNISSLNETQIFDFKDFSSRDINTQSEFIFFHECCWDEVDKLIIRNKILQKKLIITQIKKA